MSCISYTLSDPMEEARMSDSSESSSTTPDVRKRKRADYSKLSPDERTQKRFVLLCFLLNFTQVKKLFKSKNLK